MTLKHLTLTASPLKILYASKVMQASDYFTALLPSVVKHAECKYDAPKEVAERRQISSQPDLPATREY
jgi:hypothetical protein